MKKDLDEEKVKKFLLMSLLPYADGDWRKDFPDDWEWDEKTLTILCERISKSLCSHFSLPKDVEISNGCLHADVGYKICPNCQSAIEKGRGE